MPVIMRLPIIIALVLSLTACATMGTVDQTVQRHKTLLQLAVTIGVGRFLNDHPAHARLVYEIAHGARVTLGTGTIDVTQIVPTIQEQIERHTELDADVRLLLTVLVQAIASEVQQYLARVDLSHMTDVLLAAEALGWVEQAAAVKLGGV